MTDLSSFHEYLSEYADRALNKMSHMPGLSSWIMPAEEHEVSNILAMELPELGQDVLLSVGYGDLMPAKVVQPIQDNYCQHRYVNMGFNSIHMVCKYCGVDQ